MTEHKTTRAACQAWDLRGGWIAKRGKQVITAPAQWGCVGLAAPRPLSARIAFSTSALALGLALGMGGVTPAAAGSCVGGPTNWLCSAPANSMTDTTQTITVTSGNSGTITTHPSFGIEVTSLDAIRIEGERGSTGITFTDTHQSSIIGADNGLSVVNFGTGALEITATGDLIGLGDHRAGIRAVNLGNDSDLTISVANATGDRDGIQATNDLDTGAFDITVTGEVTGTSRAGLYALNIGTDLTITGNEESSITGYSQGIWAMNYGSGALSITSTGSVEATGGSGKGILANHYGTDLTMEVHDVSGVSSGIHTSSFGSGALSITTTGNVTATDSGGRGIYARNDGSSGEISMTVQEGSTVSATSGQAIEVAAGNTTLNIAGAVDGDVTLAKGDDTVNIDSTADLEDLTGIDAGGGTNALNFRGFQGGLDGGIFADFSTIRLTSGSPGAEVGFGSGVTATTGLAIDPGSTLLLNAPVATFTTPLLTNDGTIRTGLYMATITGDLDGTGTIVVDIDFETGVFGSLAVDGDFRAGSTQTIEVLPQGAVVGKQTSFAVLSVTGDFDGSVELGTDAVTVGALTYGLSLDTTATPGTVLVEIGAQIMPGENPVAAVTSSHVLAVTETFSAARSMQSRQAARQFGSGATTVSVSERLLPAISSQGTLGAADLPHLGRAQTVTVGPWAMLEVDRFNQRPDTGQQAQGTALRFEAGHDALVDTAGEGTLVLGGGVVLGTVDARFTAGGGAASSSASGGGVLLTATYFTPGGTFLDMELRGAHARSRLKSPDGTTLASGIGSTTFQSKFEIGHSFALDPHSVLTPSVQVSLGQVRTQGYTTSDGDVVSSQRDDISELRLGLAYGRALESGGSFTLFGAYTRDLSPSSQVTVNGVSQTIRSPHDWAEVGLRAGTPLGERGRLSGEFGYRTALGSLASGNSNAFARVGLDFQW